MRSKTRKNVKSRGNFKVKARGFSPQIDDVENQLAQISPSYSKKNPYNTELLASVISQVPDLENQLTQINKVHRPYAYKQKSPSPDIENQIKQIYAKSHRDQFKSTKNNLDLKHAWYKEPNPWEKISQSQVMPSAKQVSPSQFTDMQGNSYGMFIDVASGVKSRKSRNAKKSRKSNKSRKPRKH